MSEYENVISRLREENGRLSELLEQAQTDKEFVWSLWKRLQVSSPDLTQAISMVVQREKDKAEEKDAKVLQILQLKDKKIEELQNIVTTQSKELTAIIQQKADLTENVKRLEADIVSANERSRNLNNQLLSRETDAEDWRRKMMNGVEKQNSEMSDKIASLQTELTRVKTENGDLNAEKIALEGRNVAAEREVARLRKEILDRREQGEGEIRRLEAEIDDVKMECVSHQTEAVNAEKEVEKLVSRLEITQAQFEKQNLLLSKMESVEENKEAILRNKEEAHSKMTADLTSLVKRVEMENSRLRGLLSRRGTSRPRKKAVKSWEIDDRKADEEEDWESLDEEGRGEDEAPVVDMNYRVKRMERQLHLLEDCLARRDEVIRTLRESNNSSNVPSPVRRGAYVRQNRCARLRSKSAPMRCVRRCMTQETLQRQLLSAERMVTDLENVVAEKEEEICSLRQTMDVRGRKIRNLKCELRRSQMRWRESELDQERDLVVRLSDDHISKVTNELAHLRNSYNNLVIKNTDLNEEIAQLKSRMQEDDSTIRRLEGAEHTESREKNRMTEDLDQAKLKVRLLEEQLCVVNRHNSSTTRNLQQAWECEKRGLKSEIDNLATELSSKRVEIANLHRDLKHLREDKDYGDRLDCNNHGSAMADILDHFAEQEAGEKEGGDVGERERQRRHVRWSNSGEKPPRVDLEELDRVPTRDGLPSSDSSATRTEESQPSSRVGLRLAGPRQTQKAILMRRLASLQQQLRALRKSKKQSVAALSTLQERSARMAQKLELANARGRRLRTALHQAMSNNNARETESESSFGEAADGEKREGEWREMEKRLRGEVARQTAQIRQLKEEVEARDRLVEELRDRGKRLERDASSRKKLVEEWRTKVKTAEDAARRDREELETNLQRLKEAREGAERQRVQLDSLKRRLTAVTEEKRAAEAEAEKRSRQTSEAVAKRQEAEKRWKRAEEKADEVGRRSEGAVDAARAKVAQGQVRTSRICRLLLRVVRGLAERSEEARHIVDTATATARRLAMRADSDESMRSARERAANILNISTDDVDAMLHPTSIHRGAGRSGGPEREWLRRCERLLSNGGPCDDEEAEALARSCDERLHDLISITRSALSVAQA